MSHLDNCYRIENRRASDMQCSALQLAVRSGLGSIALADVICDGVGETANLSYVVVATRGAGLGLLRFGDDCSGSCIGEWRGIRCKYGDGEPGHNNSR